MFRQTKHWRDKGVNTAFSLELVLCILSRVSKIDRKSKNKTHIIFLFYFEDYFLKLHNVSYKKVVFGDNLVAD